MAKVFIILGIVCFVIGIGLAVRNDYKSAAAQTDHRVYDDLALDLVTQKVIQIEPRTDIASEVDREKRLAEIERLRQEWVPTLPQALQKPAHRWLDANRSNTEQYVIGVGSHLKIERDEKQQRIRALAEKLHVQYPE